MRPQSLQAEISLKLDPFPSTFFRIYCSLMILQLDTVVLATDSVVK
jgi:hypothetical protein